MISDEHFFAWLDGELSPSEAAAVEAAVAADPELRRKAAAHRALAGRLGAAFGPIAEAGLPDGLGIAANSRPGELVDFAAARQRRRPAPAWSQWAAAAATLAIGFVAGSLLGAGGSAPVAYEHGQLVASGKLEAGLYTRLASAPDDAGPRIGLTFRDTSGNLCRSFTDEGATGLACHQKGDWRVRGLFASGAAQYTEFRMAVGADPRLAELIDATMAGEPLDAAGERRALAQLR